MSVTDTKQRREERFASRDGGALSTQLLILRGESIGVIDCELSDISIGGCAVRAKLDRHCDLTVAILRLRHEAFGLNLDVAGKLCWNQQTSVGSNSFGFRFRRPLEPDLIDVMVSEGLVTRRQDDRVRCDAEIGVRRAHGKTPIGLAVLEDCSSTGVRLTVDTIPEVGERLLLTTQCGDSGSVSVVWVSRRFETVQCGCSFVNLASARTINDAVTRAMALPVGSESLA